MRSVRYILDGVKLIDDIRRENLERLQKELGSLRALADLLGKDESQVSQWKQGSKNSGTGKPRGMRSETARHIEEKTGKTRGWLDVDHSPEALPTSNVYPIRMLGDFLAAAPLSAWDYASWDTLPTDAQSVFIPRLDVRSADGQVTVRFVTTHIQTFGADWIRQDQLHPDKLGTIEAPDDSMKPSIFPGDVCVVDTSQTTVVDGKAYAISYGGDTVPPFRRLFRLPGGGLRIQADNPMHPPIELNGSQVGLVTIVGRVVKRFGSGDL